MIRFTSDYTEGAAPEILAALSEINLHQYSGYGTDPLCEEAKKLISYEIESENADIHFFVGGTQCNMTFIAASLRPHEAVVAVDTGHIAVHETGAVESTGHKVLTIPAADGKMRLEDLEMIYNLHRDEHMVKPRLIYLSQTTELGTVYQQKELNQIADFAHNHGMLLYIDGARLGSALTAEKSDCTLAHLAKVADAFSIGGTKNGMLFGEALVIVNDALKPDFRYFIKQKGGLLAKGWLLGLQFQVMFRDGLYYRLAEHANEQSRKIYAVLEECRIPMFAEAVSNQLFPIFPWSFIMELAQNFSFEIIEKIGADKAVIRLVTSWATADHDVEILCTWLRKFRVE